MSRIPFLPVPALLVALALLGTHPFPWTENPAVETSPVRAGGDPILEKNARFVLGVYCSSCHNQGRAKIDLDNSLEVTQMRDRPTWENVVRVLRAGKMPPPDGRWPQPSQQERLSLITWIEHEFLKETPVPQHLARVRVRRLQGSEYQNTIRDLVGIHFHPPSDFPMDETAWKHVQQLPPLSPHLLEKYQAAAEQIVHDMTPKVPTTLSPPSDEDPPDSGQVPLPSIHHSPPPQNQEDHFRDFIANFAYRAFRRPLLKKELENLVAVFHQGEKEALSDDERLKVVLKTVLTSPFFLYRIETVSQAPSSARSQFELASRLSYFLWGSMPDEELLAQAEQNVLLKNLDGQARRMLEDQKAKGLAEDFPNFWLHLDKLREATGDEGLLSAARQETQHFVANIIQEDRSVLEFLHADYTYLNERLARHYRISGIQGEDLRRVSLQGGQRGGLLTQASVLILMSPSGDPSPVLRGKWVLENILGSAPLAPPSGLLQAFNESRKVFEPGTARQLLEKHRTNPSCAACHAKMDAFGLALENFDGTGAWRNKANGWPVDATGTLPSGESFTGPAQLKAYLLGKQDGFIQTLSAKLLSFALGRKLENADLSALETIPQRVAQNQNRFSSVLLEVIRSDPFLDGKN